MMKLLENKVQEQSKEIAIRSKTIEQLQYSLNLLIEKYNELKKKFDIVVNEFKTSFQEKNDSHKNTVQGPIEVWYFGSDKLKIAYQEVEIENSRIKNKYIRSCEEYDKTIMSKNEEIHSLHKRINEISNTFYELNDLKELLVSSEKRAEAFEKQNLLLLSEKDSFIKALEKAKLKYCKYKNKYKKLQQDFTPKAVHELCNELQFSICESAKIQEFQSNMESFRINSSCLAVLASPIIKKSLETKKMIEQLKIFRDNYFSKLKTIETKFSNDFHQKIKKIEENKKKIVEAFSKQKEQSLNTFNYKKELVNEVNKFNEINNSLSNKITKLEVEKTKLIYQIQNYENIIKKNEKKVKSLSDSISDNQNTIVKLNLKIEGLILENSKINKKEVSDTRDELEREKGINFILNKKVEELQKLLGQFKIENEGKSKIIEERNQEIRQIKISLEKLQNK